MRSAVGTVLELVGVAVVLAAAYALDVRAALALAGAGLVVLGYVIADPRRARKG